MLMLPAGAFCNMDHAIAYAQTAGKRLRAKKERKTMAEQRDRLKSRSDWLREAQIAFNAYVRERDSGLACVSCGRNTGAKMNAGHYRSVGSCPSLRFEPLNCWLQCEACNSYLSGNLIPYRQELLRRIGPEKLEWLEGPHDPKRYTVEQIQEIKRHYVKLRRQIACSRAHKKG